MNKHGMLTVYIPKSDRKVVERFKEIVNARRENLGTVLLGFMNKYVEDTDKTREVHETIHFTF